MRGRLIAPILFALYAFGFKFSLALGVAVAVALLVLLPTLLRGALRFHPHHARYRALRFHFSGGVADAYKAYLPALPLLVLPALWAGSINRYLIGTSALAYVLWPLVHGMMKRYQHSDLRLGSAASSYQLGLGRLYRPYLAAAGITVLAAIVAVAAAIAIELGAKALTDTSVLRESGMFPMVAAAIVVYLMYVVTIPYLRVRLRNLAWNATVFPGVRIRSTMSARSFVELQLINTVLTLLTFGLYRPSALVNSYAYQVAHTEIVTDSGLNAVMAHASGLPGGASGARAGPPFTHGDRFGRPVR